MNSIQSREEHWAIADLVGRGAHNPPYLVRRSGASVEIAELKAGGTVFSDERLKEFLRTAVVTVN